jgi:predicted permease
MLDRIRIDLLHAWRSLRRSPGFTAVAVLSLALGIGASTAAFSLVNSLRLRSLPYHHADQLYDLAENHPTEVCAGCGVGTSWLTYQDWQREAHAWSGMAAYREDQVGVAFPGGAARQRVARVTATLFPLLGIAPLAGRPFTSEEDRPGARRVALISEQLWQTQFGRAASVLGATVRIEGEVHQVIGVMPAGFAIPQFAELWVPLTPLVATEARSERSIGVIARLADGLSIDAARSELAALSVQLERSYPPSQQGWYAIGAPLREELTGDYIGSFTMLLGAIGFVLLITCANLATLMLARATARQLDLSVRAALGASRGDLMRGLMLEAVILSGGGGLLGLLVASWLIGVFRALPGDPLPLWVEVGIDPRVVAFASGISLLSGLLIGLLPARQAARANLHEVIKGVAATTRRFGLSLREVLVVTQIAGAMTLVIGAGLFARSFLIGQSRAAGYDTRHLARADVILSATMQRDPLSFSVPFLEKLERGGGITSAALHGLHIINWPGTPRQDVRADGVSPETAAAGIRRIVTVTPRYFSTLGLQLRSGRTLGADDIAGRVPVTVIGSALADQLWPGRDPLGRQVTIGETSWTIVGVLADPKVTSDAPRPAGLLYMSMAQLPALQPTNQPLSLALRTTPDAYALATQVRDAARAVNQDVVIEQLMSVDDFSALWATPLRRMAIVTGSLGLFAALLAALGIYGVMNYLASQRTREFGVRIALGASRWRVTRVMLDRGVVLGITGVVIGAALALALTRYVQSQLYGVQASDPSIYFMLAGGFLFVMTLAAWLPAYKASRVDPMVALRSA